MPPKVPIDEEASRGWVEVAHGSRTLQHCLRHAAEPRSGSAFAKVGVLYPFEKVRDRVRAYLTAGVEHLIFWADVQVPLKFHPEHSVEVTLRPSYTLARACLEAAAQAVWLMNTTDPMECIRRHICLMRWDLQELRKSRLDPAAKSEAKGLETNLLHRVSEVFSDEQVRAPQGSRGGWSRAADHLTGAQGTASRATRLRPQGCQLSSARIAVGEHSGGTRYWPERLD